MGLCLRLPAAQYHRGSLICLLSCLGGGLPLNLLQERMHSPPASQSPSPTPPPGGSELRALMRAVDQELSSLLGKLQAAVVALHAKHSGGGSGGNGAAASLGHGDDSEEVSGALRLLLVYAELSAGMGVLEAEIRCELWGAH